METFTHEQQGHVMWKCEYHVVIVPKYRKKILYGPVRQRAGQIIRELAKRKGVEVVEGNACPDHIHMILSVPPRYSVSEIIGFIKGKTAIRLHFEFGRRHGNLQQKSFWSRGYFVSTVGVDRDQIIRYVQGQWKNDRFIDGPELDLHWSWAQPFTIAPFRGFPNNATCYVGGLFTSPCISSIIFCLMSSYFIFCAKSHDSFTVMDSMLMS